MKNGKSPAQMLFGRQIRDNLPTLSIKFNTNEKVKRDLQGERKTAKEYYDRKVPRKQKLELFRKNQRVVVQNEKTKEWDIRGSIMKEIAPRSYMVKMDKGGEVRRNRKFIRKLYYITSNGNAIKEKERVVEVELGDQDVETSFETIPYEEEDTLPYEGQEEEETNIYEKHKETKEIRTEERSQRGRVIKHKQVLDYEDL